MNNSAKLPAWDLKDLYKSLTDSALKKDKEFVISKSNSFLKTLRSLKNPTVKEVEKLFISVENIYEVLSKLSTYAGLLFADSCLDQKRQSFYQEVSELYSSIASQLVSFDHKLLVLPLKTQEELVKSNILINYKRYLQKLFATKKHRLHENEEILLEKKQLSGRAAWVRFFDEEFARKEFKFGSKKQILTETEVLNKLYSTNRNIRKEAAKSLSIGLQEESRRLSYVFNTLSLDKQVDDELRHFDNPEDSRHIENDISKKDVDCMIAAVTGAYPLVQKFYQWKKKKLKLDIIYDYDRYAPIMGKSEVNIPWDNAKQLVLESFYAFDKEIGDIAKLFFDKKWIDAADRPGKRGGAFCSFAVPSVHPYVFMNYSGSMRDVFTLAHELGHAVHAYLMRKNTMLNYDVPLTLAETASVFGEMLLFDRLKQERLTEDQFLALHVTKVENIFATVFRQTSMFLFERDIHSLRQSGEVPADKIGELWINRQKTMFGESVTLTDDYKSWWSYIPHFVHTPFYVYAYAFGELLTLALWTKYQKDKKGFVPKYKEFLSTGGGLNAKESLKIVGFDTGKKELWDLGIQSVKDLVNKVTK